MVLWGRSVLGRQKVPRKVPPRFSTKVQQGCSTVPPVLQVSWCLWFSAEWFRGRIHQGCTEVSPGFHQDCASFVVSLVFWGSSLGLPKGSVEGSPITVLNLFSSWNSFLHFSSTTLALRSSAIVKILGQNDTFVFLGSLQQMAFASPKVLWSVPQTVLCIGLTVSCGFWAHGCCFRKVLWRVPPTILYICLPNGCCFRKVVWRVPPTVLYIYLPVSSWGQHLSSIQIQSAENDPSCRCCWGILWAYLLSQASVSRLVYSMQVDLCFVSIAW